MHGYFLVRAILVNSWIVAGSGIVTKSNGDLAGNLSRRPGKAAWKTCAHPADNDTTAEPHPKLSRLGRNCDSVAMNSAICDTINDRYLLELRYHVYSRSIEPYAYGRDRDGEKILRCYQQSRGAKAARHQPRHRQCGPLSAQLARMVVSRRCLMIPTHPRCVSKTI